MTSRKRRRKRTEESKLRRAKALASIDTRDPNLRPPPDSVMADHSQLAHNNTYAPLPLFYVDKLVVCRNCGTEEVWPAERQKWWYEVAKGNIFTEAVLCRACRKKEKERKNEARRIHMEGLAAKETKQIKET
ncbi:MAG: zinc-ribbon domain containing protein [Thermodesulfobacteriota bacterium]|nr:zinc-ribbon domain containing protein [Thermodesulfobacteriota bacterium]